jgi:hypothetical protein
MKPRIVTGAGQRPGAQVSALFRKFDYQLACLNCLPNGVIWAAIFAAEVGQRLTAILGQALAARCGI